MRLLGSTVLRNADGLCSRGHGPRARQRHQSLCRHIFKLGGDGRTFFCQRGQAFGIKVIGLDVMVAHQPGGAGRVRVQHRRGIAHGLRGVHKHAPQLPAAHHTQGHGFSIRRQTG